MSKPKKYSTVNIKGIDKVRKSVHPDLAINTDTAEQLQYIMESLAIRIIKQGISVLSSKGGKITLAPKELTVAVKMLFPQYLQGSVLADANRAVEKLEGSDQGSLAQRAELHLVPPRFETLIRKHHKGFVSSQSGVFLAAVIEHMIAEILSLAGARTRDNKKVRITIRDVTLTIESDDLLKELFCDLHLVVSGGGVSPSIDPRVLPEKEKTRKYETGEDGVRRAKYTAGMKTLGKIRQQQATTDKAIPHLSVDHLVRSVTEQLGETSRFEKSAIELIHLHLENCIVSNLRNAYKIALAGDKETLTKKHLDTLKGIVGC